MKANEREAYQAVRNFASDFPDIALKAVIDGHEDAMSKLRQRLNEKDQALLSALALVKSNRIDVETRNMLNKRVASAINPDGMCDLERQILDDVKDAQ
jgi:hypothetical protein